MIGDLPGQRSPVRGWRSRRQAVKAARLLFDESWYTSVYDLPSREVDAWSHFLSVGWMAGDNPNRWFSTCDYLSRYPDVRAAGTNPFRHFVSTGQREGRTPMSTPTEPLNQDFTPPRAEGSAKMPSGENSAREVRETRSAAKRFLFVLPGLGISGGVNVVVEYAERLAERGHEVWIQNAGGDADLRWRTRAGVNLVGAYEFDQVNSRSWDAVIATGWQTVYEIAWRAIPARSYLYFVQAWEPDFYEPDSAEATLAEATYGLDGWRLISEAQWLVEKLQRVSGRPVKYVRNGLNDYFHESAEPFEARRGRKRVLLEGPLGVPRKRMDDAFLAVQGIDAEVWLVTSGGGQLKAWQRPDRMFRNVPIDQMPSIYASCDVMVKLPSVEGMFGPPLEFMAQGGVPITSDVAGHDEYMVDGYNGFVVPIGDWQQAQSRLRDLLVDDERIRVMAAAGQQTAASFRWDPSVDLFEEFLQEASIGDEDSEALSSLADSSGCRRYMTMAHGAASDHLRARALAARAIVAVPKSALMIDVASGWWAGELSPRAGERRMRASSLGITTLGRPDVAVAYPGSDSFGWMAPLAGSDAPWHAVSDEFLQVIREAPVGEVVDVNGTWGQGQLRKEFSATWPVLELSFQRPSHDVGWPVIVMSMAAEPADVAPVVAPWPALVIFDNGRVVSPLVSEHDGSRLTHLEFEDTDLISAVSNGTRFWVAHRHGAIPQIRLEWRTP